MAINYTKNEWKNTGEIDAIPLSADNLNNMEDGIKASADAVDEIIPCYVKTCDLTNVVYKIDFTDRDKGSESWKTTEDCWVSVYCEGYSSSDFASLKVDGVVIFNISMPTGNSSRVSSFLLPPCFFIKAGSTVTFSKGAGKNYAAYCKFYGCINSNIE